MNRRKFHPTVRKLIQNGRWSGRYQLDVPARLSETGARQRLSFATERAAKEEARKIENRFLTGQVEHKIVDFSPTFQAVVKDWHEHEKIRMMARHIQASTVEKNLTYAKALLGEFAQVQITRINSDAILKYQASRRESGRKVSTINSEVRTLRMILGWAHRAGLIEAVPVYKAVPEITPEHLVPTQAEVGRILAELDDEVRLICELMVMTGMRKSEVLTLRWCDIRLDRLAILVSPTEENPKKTRHAGREVFINEEMAVSLKSIQKRSEKWVFPSLKDSNQPRGDFKKAFASAVHRSKLHRDGQPVQFTPKSLRKAFATWQAEKGIPESVLQVLMGHAFGSRVTGQHYVRVNAESFRNEIVAVSPYVISPSKISSGINANWQQMAIQQATPVALHSEINANSLESLEKNGAGEAIRTPDPNLGKVVLYP